MPGANQKGTFYISKGALFQPFQSALFWDVKVMCPSAHRTGSAALGHNSSLKEHNKTNIMVKESCS